MSNLLIVSLMIVNCGKYAPPVSYKEACVTQGFHNGHRAIDIGSYGQKRVKIFAVWDGTVIATCNGARDKDQKTCGPYGNHIRINHGTFEALYAHLTSGSLKVSKGTKVKKGQLIGLMGTSGWSTGVHLHVEVKKKAAGSLHDIRSYLDLKGWKTC